MEAVWTEGTISAVVCTTGATVVAGGVCAESAGAVVVPVHPAARARISVTRARVRIECIRIRSPDDKIAKYH
jgi:hypothetical protein